MKRFLTDSDVGGVLIGNKDFGVVMANREGDGCTTVFIFEDESEFKNNKITSWWFNTAIDGVFNIYNYDCSKRKDEDIIETLNGRYGVYAYGMAVAFVKWD